MLARELAMALCMCLSVSVTSRCSVETGERIELVLAWELPSTYPTLCYKEIQISSKIRVLPSRTFLQSLDFENFRHSTSTVEACYQLSSRKADVHSAINWTVVGQLS